ncbi:MAG: sigma-54-dependent Fis family transcriptional regulator [Deltaproteobacteria bacterium]|nr:sigma-54-dependent Fis family transcriptional regulator [Deltaproteobacteria bacterium]
MAKHDQASARSSLDLAVASVLLGKAAPAVAAAAAHDAPLLLCGETGSGKGVAAQAVHAQSRRRSGPFVVVNCASLTPEMAASTLFGHRRGAFTGAVADHAGAFSRAHCGTLFLDEIGELPIAVQPQLLRAVEAGVVAALGCRNELPVDVRLICATHVDLPAAVHAGRFRADLLERIADEVLTLAPLRDRLAELPALAATMQAKAKYAPPLILWSDALVRMRGYSWPGNLRELDKTLARVARRRTPGDLSPVCAAELVFGLLGAAGAVTPTSPTAAVESSSPPHWSAAATEAVLDSRTAGAARAKNHSQRTLRLEAHAVDAAIERHAGNRTRAAADLGVDRTSLLRWLRRRPGSRGEAGSGHVWPNQGVTWPGGSGHCDRGDGPDDDM